MIQFTNSPRSKSYLPLIYFFIIFKLIPLPWVRNNIMWTIFAIHHYHEWKLFSQTVVKSNYSSLFLTYWSFSSEFPRYKTDSLPYHSHHGLTLYPTTAKQKCFQSCCKAKNKTKPRTTSFMARLQRPLSRHSINF